MGKYRVIDGIEFYEKHPTNEIPDEWSLMLLNEWGGPVCQVIHGKGERIIREFPPVRMQAIEVIIRKPMLQNDGKPYHWRIANVYLREVKLFGRWIRRKI